MPACWKTVRGTPSKHHADAFTPLLYPALASYKMAKTSLVPLTALVTCTPLPPPPPHMRCSAPVCLPVHLAWYVVLVATGRTLGSYINSCASRALCCTISLVQVPWSYAAPVPRSGVGFSRYHLSQHPLHASDTLYSITSFLATASSYCCLCVG